MSRKVYDILVIGGGINGAGIAADAAGRGLSVMLAEAADLAGATSSASSKLVHGGIRYLEHYEFRLVREALAEREILLAKAPHIIWPLRFVLPRVEGMRPRWMLSAGLFLYDRLALRRTLPKSTAIDLAADAAGRALDPRLTHGYAYWDCWVDDARLVVLNAIAARDLGARIATRSPVTSLSVGDGRWLATLGGAASGETVAARAIVNAAGPWASVVAALAIGRRNAPPPSVRLVKGSHIVVPRVAGVDDAYIFQARDGRVVFALPFEGRFTLIGTTDEPFAGDPRAASASEAETGYLIDVCNAMLRRPLTRADIVHTFAGVRALDDDGSATASEVSRDYRLVLEVDAGAPMLNVIGGKITTYRRLAEGALAALQPHFPEMGPAHTSSSPLPGGDIGAGDFEAWFAGFCAGRRGFETDELRRMARRYGTRTEALLAEARTPADLGRQLGGGLTEREVSFLKRWEWAETPDDVLWRRTKAGLGVAPADMDRVRDSIALALASS